MGRHANAPFRSFDQPLCRVKRAHDRLLPVKQKKCCRKLQPARKNNAWLRSGGHVLMKPEVLHVGRPNIGDRDALLARINGMLDRRWLTNDGPLVKEFEQRIADFVGVRHCITMCNATVALEIASRALGFSGEVIVPSFTFVATAHALQWQGITPVFTDIDPRTHNIDTSSIERLITERTTGIIGVHVWGRPCDTTGIADVASRHGLKVLYDAAHAFGCSHDGRMIGGFGGCEVFSFHATKFINSFEGGAVVTNDDALAAKLRLMRNFGFKGLDNVEYPGVNGKMTGSLRRNGTHFSRCDKRDNVCQPAQLRGVRPPLVRASRRFTDRL